MNYGGSNGVYETQMFLVERIVFVNSSRSTTLCCKREFRRTGLSESVLLEFIQIVDCVNTLEEIHLGND